MDVQSRFLLVAVLGVWTGFLGLMAVVATEAAFPKMLGAVALACGLVIAVAGLNRVVGDRPATIDQRAPQSTRNAGSDS